jgi:hypothetical protein
MKKQSLICTLSITLLASSSLFATGDLWGNPLSLTVEESINEFFNLYHDINPGQVITRPMPFSEQDIWRTADAFRQQALEIYWGSAKQQCTAWLQAAIASNDVCAIAKVIEAYRQFARMVGPQAMQEVEADIRRLQNPNDFNAQFAWHLPSHF